MKLFPCVFIVVVCVAGCSLIFGGPTATVKKYMEASRTGDVDSMNQLFSSRAIKGEGIEKIRESNQQFAEMSQAANSRKYQMNNVNEKRVGDHALVGFHYQSEDESDSVRLVFALSKENGAWKIDNTGGAELEEIDDITSAAVKDGPPPKHEPTLEEMPPPVEPEASPSAANSPLSKPTPPRTPISAGVLNGKAISLPKPSFPPMARAAKASGPVVVQVTVDENGNVTQASAVSGHPLLRPSAVAAARSAKFSPTKIAGQPVKVTGVVTYNFVVE